MLLNRPQQRKILLQADALEAQGSSLSEICEIVGLKKGELRSLRKRELMIFSVPGPWQMIYNGKSWKDMPGCDPFSQRCFFALFRRGIPIPTSKDHGRMKPRGRPRKLKSEIQADDVEGAVPDVAPATLSW